MGKKQITVIIEGTGILRQKVNKQMVTFNRRALVKDIAKKVKITKGINIAYFRNGKRLQLHEEMDDGDYIKIVPLLYGG